MCNEHLLLCIMCTRGYNSITLLCYLFLVSYQAWMWEVRIVNKVLLGEWPRGVFDLSCVWNTFCLH